MFYIKEQGSVFNIECFPWKEYESKPKTSVKISYDDGGYFVHFESFETNLRAVQTEHNTFVHEDSCMELFAAFASDDDNYINIEINPNGAAHCEVGNGRAGRYYIDPCEIETLGIRTETYPNRWTIDYYIPVDFIKAHLPTYQHKKGTRLRANFYKCGDKTGHEHYGCFSPIEWPHPDFHRPEFFAEFELA